MFARCGQWQGYRVIRLSRGCSALREHRLLRRELKRCGLLHLAQRQRVRTVTISRLLQQYNARSIGVLALDCEGHDCEILNGLIEVCDSSPFLCPNWIWFESNSMNDDLFGRGMEEQTVQKLLDHGYET